MAAATPKQQVIVFPLIKTSSCPGIPGQLFLEFHSKKTRFSVMVYAFSMCILRQEYYVEKGWIEMKYNNLCYLFKEESNLTTIFLLIILLFTAPVFHSEISAATLTVNSIADDTVAGDGAVTFREAINASNNKTKTDLGETGDGNDTIVFEKNVFVDLQTISLTMGEINIGSNVSIMGKGADRLILDGSKAEILHVRDNAKVLIESLTIKNGIARGGDGETKGTGGGGGAGMGGALYIDYGQVTCVNVNFESNQAIGGNGGGTQLISDGGNGGASSHGISEGGKGATENVGNWGGYGAGGGGGVAEWIGHHSADNGGNGGFGGGGGGGGGGAFTYANGGKGGQFGGQGGFGSLGWINGGGGGGAGLGGAIYVSEHGSLTLEKCLLKKNIAQGGQPGPLATRGQGKGGAVFVQDGASISVLSSTFESNLAVDALGINNPELSDNFDIYGKMNTLESSLPVSSIVVTTLVDENSLSQTVPGTGVSLREAIQKVQDGGTLSFSESILPGTITVNPQFGSLMIEKNLNIEGPGVDKLTISGGNLSRVFFVGRVKAGMRCFCIAGGLGRGGNGMGGGGGAAGMGGGLFANRSTITLDQINFVNCRSQCGEIASIYGYGNNLGGGGGGFGGDARGNLGGYGGELAISSGSDIGDGRGGNGASGDSGVIRWISPGNGGFAGGGGGGNTLNMGGGAHTSSPPGVGGYGGGNGGHPGWIDLSGGYGFGAALFIRDGSTLNLTNCHFENNTAYGWIHDEIKIFDKNNNYRTPASRGSAIFAMNYSTVYGSQLSFANNKCEGFSLPSGLKYGVFNDSHDVYGSIKSFAPIVLSVSRESQMVIDRNNKPEVTYLVTFNTEVKGVDAGDFIIIKDGTLNDVLITDVEVVSSSQYRIHTAYGIGYGKISLRLMDNDSILSISHNLPLMASDESPDGSFIGEFYDILPQVIPLQAVLPLQGVSSLYGQKAKEGFDLAISDINRKGGLFGSKFEMRYHDTGSTETGAQQAVIEALADPLSPGVLSVLSANTISIATPVTEQKMSLFSPATGIQLRGYPKYVAKTCPLDDYQVNAMIHYLKNEVNNKVVVLAEKSNYGTSILKILQQTNSLQIDKFYQFTTGDLQNNPAAMPEMMKELASASADTMIGIFAGYAGDANAFFKAVQNDPVLRNYHWLVSDGCVFEETLKDLPPIYFTNNVVGFAPATCGFLSKDHSEDFQYEKMFNKKATWDVYYNYDTALTFFKAFEINRNADPKTLWNVIPGLSFTGVTGLKEFDREGELVSAVYSINKVRNGQWTVVGQDRIDQPPPGVIPHSSGAIGGVTDTPDPRSLGFKQWLPGDDLGIGHFCGMPGEKESWVASSGDLDEGYNLIAYYEDGRRDQNNYGKSFIFADGMPYHLSFDMSRDNLAGSPGQGLILEIEVTAVRCFLDEEGDESFNSSSLLKQTVSFNDWPAAGLKRIDVPFVYHAPDMPDLALPYEDASLLKWELRLFNAAKQQVELRKVWTWSEPLDGELAPVDSAVSDWSLQ